LARFLAAVAFLHLFLLDFEMLWWPGRFAARFFLAAEKQVRKKEKKKTTRTC
jgi:uncharacterized membrane protein